MNTKFAGKVLRMFFVLTFLLGTVSTSRVHVKALNDAVFTPHTIAVWQDSSDRWWVENDYYRIELTEFSSLVVKSGDSDSEWKIFSNWPWLSSHAVTFSGQFYRLLYGNGTPITVDVLEQTVDYVIIRVMSVASADENVVLQNMFTFNVSTPEIKVDSELIGAADSSLFEAITYNLFLSPGGDISNDWYDWPGGEPNVFPYNGWDTIYTSEFTPINNHIYIATYDLNKKQGIALISNLNDTSEFTTDIRYGRASVEGTYGAYDPDSLLSMAGDRKTSFYIYLFDVEDSDPVAKIESFLQDLHSNQSPVADAGEPYTVFAGDIITLDASTSSDPDGDVLTYEWDLDNDGQYDEASGVIITTSFNQVGDHIIGLRVTDSGGSSDTDTAIITILPWTLKGFYQPVDMNGTYNIVKSGSTIPLKFEIFADSTELIDITYIKSLTYVQTSCDVNATTDEIETIATGNTSLRYADGQFIYNWKTPNTAGRCYRVTMTTIDGSSLAAYFKLK